MTFLKSRDLLLAMTSVLFILVLHCSAMKVDLSQLLRGKQANGLPSTKRIADGNPCDEPERPFPCKGSSTCIPMKYVCDENYDCEDGSDEDVDMCTALDRPPVENIQEFLFANKGWIMQRLFGDKNINKVAHTLAVSQTVDDFRRRLGLSSKEVKSLHRALDDVKHGDEEDLEKLGMPPSAWNDVNFIFSRLLKAGFA